MPRKARPNRTDMLAQPVTTPTGGAYGAAQQSRQAQQAVPLAQEPSPGATAGPVDMQSALQSAQQFQMPMGLTAPTQFPDEPLTHGMAGGPGGGPEVLSQPGPDGLLIRGISALEEINPDGDPNVARLLAVAKATLRQRGVQ